MRQTSLTKSSCDAAGMNYPGTKGENVELLATCSTVTEFWESDLCLSSRLCILGLGFLLMFKQGGFPTFLKLQNPILFKFTLVNMVLRFVMK